MSRPGAALLGALALCACSPEAPQARIAAKDCHRLQLVHNGVSVLGVEDLAYDPTSDTVFLSAYDRLAVERAPKGRDAPEPPGGGLFALPAAALVGQRAEPRELLGGLLPSVPRPHGIDVALAPNGAARVAVVNRAFVRDDAGRWRQRPEIVVVDMAPEGARFAARVLSPRLCRANDLAFQEPELLAVSLDRGACVEDGRQPVGGPAMAAATLEGSVRVAPSPVAFPNGVVSSFGKVWLAGTLESRLALLDGRRRVALPGSPDNLTTDTKGRLVAALHPQLWRFAGHRYGWWGFGRAPSRVVRFDPERGSLAVLFDDRDGNVFAGATAAAVVRNRLVLGAVREPGLLVCAMGAAA